MQVKQVSPKEVSSWIKDIATQILLSGKKYDYVIGIEKGGLHLSKPLSNLLCLPHKSVRISFYEHGSAPALDPIVETNGFIYQPNGLLVDDLIDEGRTINEFNSLFGKLDVAVLLWNEDAFTEKPEYYGAVKPKEWVIFPWEQ